MKLLTVQRFAVREHIGGKLTGGVLRFINSSPLIRQVNAFRAWLVSKLGKNIDKKMDYRFQLTQTLPVSNEIQLCDIVHSIALAFLSLINGLGDFILRDIQEVDHSD